MKKKPYDSKKDLAKEAKKYKPMKQGDLAEVWEWATDNEDHPLAEIYESACMFAEQYLESGVFLYRASDEDGTKNGLCYRELDTLHELTFLHRDLVARMILKVIDKQAEE